MSTTPGAAGRALIGALREPLRDAADAERARRMQAYMKSAMPFRGVSSPEQRRICRIMFDAHRLPTAAACLAMLRQPWRDARYREERYASWDYVAQIASHRLSALLEHHPAAMEPQMRAWATAPELWKRRAAILRQLLFRDYADVSLLFACITPNLARSVFGGEFFIRRAIGWALRTYALVDPAEVLRFVRAHHPELSPRSKRAALKRVLARDAIAVLT